MITTILIFSLALGGVGVATITAFQQSVLERKILELEKEIDVVRSEVRGRKGK